ncbi:MAG: DUF4189 domain-containing protein [Rhizobiales bacterium]|jgi:hypothetical protein|nr:DUF4189 domain-containing protein [Hyphomicrobiales bacterium]
MNRFLNAAALLVFCVAAASPVHAAGALAVAEPADIVKDGYAAGISYHKKTAAEADQTAIRECESVDSAPVSTRKLCKVVSSFENQCAAVALDPEAGTPGAGWGVATTLADARREALRRCEATAGAKRQGECRVTAEGCDGKAK